MLNRLKETLKYFYHYRAIRRSGLFDRGYYLRNNLDVARSCSNPIMHYIRHGWREGRNPCESFDGQWYLETYPDVAEADINPLYHYLKHGFQENRNPSADFDKNNRLLGQGNWKHSVNDMISVSSNISRPQLFFSLLLMSIKKPGVLFKLLSTRRLKSALLTLFGRHEEPSLLLDRYQSVFDDSSQAVNTLLENALNTKTEKGDIFVFPIIDWHFRTQRPQHIALNLAQYGYRIFYFSTIPIIDDEDHLFEITEQPHPGVFLCKLRASGPPQNIYHDTMSVPVMHAYRKSILALMDKVKSKETVSLLHLPYWKPLADSIPGTVIGYDCMDHHIGFHSDSEELPPQEIELIQTADFVVTTSNYLYQNVQRWRETTLIRNGTENAMLSKKPQTLLLTKQAPIVGYIGAISEWFDIKLLISAAKRYPHWQFILVGSTLGCDEKDAAQLPNIEFIGEIPYNQVPQYLHAFDVAVIPFKITELTKATNPVKVYEYLSAGKPVVSTAMPELLLLEEHIHIARNTEEFLNKLTDAMNETSDTALSAVRRQWAGGQDWKVRAQAFDHVIQENSPLVSIVVLSYNNLGFTKACLESIEKNTYYRNYELVIVDNCSDDETIAFLKQYEAENIRCKLVNNSTNLGFAGGNNIGMKHCSGDYVVLLNNDTYVSPGWLKSLIKPLKSNPEIGLCGPVTNNIGNEAKIDIVYSDMREMEAQADCYIQQMRGELLFVETVAFFCVAVPRKVIDTVGFLDERFRLGFFEDDDYCRRVKTAGYQIAIVEDSFVHHHLSASFDCLGPERQKIFDQNKQLYEEKWGQWQPHVYRTGT